MVTTPRRMPARTAITATKKATIIQVAKVPATIGEPGDRIRPELPPPEPQGRAARRRRAAGTAFAHGLDVEADRGRRASDLRQRESRVDALEIRGAPLCRASIEPFRDLSRRNQVFGASPPADARERQASLDRHESAPHHPPRARIRRPRRGRVLTEIEGLPRIPATSSGPGHGVVGEDGTGTAPRAASSPTAWP